MLALPFSLVGSLWFLWMLEYKISVVVGMIAVAGLAVELGLLMMLYLDISWRQRRDDGQLNTFYDLTVDGAAKRLSPKLMTGLALIFGLVPIMLSNGSGADLMKGSLRPCLVGL
jgi:Cu(I)/Ag(I) efflux system membrane protein CusA/SilA